MPAAGGDLVGMAGLGMEGVGDDDYAVQAAEQVPDPVQERGERRNFVGLRRDLYLGQDDAGAGVVGRQQVHLPTVGQP
jgi:hypothetical protein